MQLNGRLSNKLCLIQQNLRNAVVAAHDDVRSDKKLRRHVEGIKKDKEKKHNQYLSEIKVR